MSVRNGIVGVQYRDIGQEYGMESERKKEEKGREERVKQIQ